MKSKAYNVDVTDAEVFKTYTATRQNIE